MTASHIDTPSKRAHIVGVAASLFARNGFEAVTMSTIAEQSGVAKGTLYLYFPTKEALFHESFAAVMAQRTQYILNRIDLTKTPLDALGDVTDAMLQFIDDAPDAHRMFVEYQLIQIRHSTSMPGYDAPFQQLREMVNGLFEAAIDARQVHPNLDYRSLTAAYVAFFDGALLHTAVLPRPSIKQMCAALIAAIEDGVVSYDK